MGGNNGGLDTAEKISELENIVIETMQKETREKNCKKPQLFSKLWYNFNSPRAVCAIKQKKKKKTIKGK